MRSHRLALAGLVVVLVVPSARANLTGTYTGAVTFSNVANAFVGDGSGLTGLSIAQAPSNSITSTQLADSIGLGSAGVHGELHVFSTAANTPAVSLIGSNSLVRTFGSDGLTGRRITESQLTSKSTYDKQISIRENI